MLIAIHYEKFHKNKQTIFEWNEIYTERPLIGFYWSHQKVFAVLRGKFHNLKITLSVMLAFIEELSCNAATAM